MILKDECLYCTKALLANADALEDTVLFENSHFVCLPSLGALVPGYVMLISKRHVTAINQLSVGETKSLVTLVRNLENLGPYREGYLIFEHGLSATEGGNACIDHFHLHLTPSVGLTLLDIENHIPFPTKKIVLPSIISLRDHNLNPGYILISNGKTHVCHVSDEFSSQFIRKILAEHVGLTEKWNWVIYPHMDRVAQTIEMVLPK